MTQKALRMLWSGKKGGRKIDSMVAWIVNVSWRNLDQLTGSKTVGYNQWNWHSHWAEVQNPVMNLVGDSKMLVINFEDDHSDHSTMLNVSCNAMTIYNQYDDLERNVRLTLKGPFLSYQPWMLLITSVKHILIWKIIMVFAFGRNWMTIDVMTCWRKPKNCFTNGTNKIQ